MPAPAQATTAADLRRMLEIQQTYLARKYDGCEGTDLERTDGEIFNIWIKPRFGIARRDFEKILARNVRRELRQLEGQAATT